MKIGQNVQQLAQYFIYFLVSDSSNENEHFLNNYHF